MTNTLNANCKACVVCHGKGGFKKVKNDFLDSNWTDCLFCDGYGFIKDSDIPVEDLSAFEKFRTGVIKELEGIAEFNDFYCSDEKGNNIYISIDVKPTERNKWVGLVKTLLRYAYYSETSTILPRQVFYFTGDNYRIHWEFDITVNSKYDLSGILDVIRMYLST